MTNWKQPEVLNRDDEGEDDDDHHPHKWYFSSATQWQTGAIYVMSLDCIFREDTVIKPVRHQLRFNLRCALGLQVCLVSWGEVNVWNTNMHNKKYFKHSSTSI